MDAEQPGREPAPVTVQPGSRVGGFRVVERLHRGGMATLWEVEPEGPTPGAAMPLIMKVPRIKGGEDPATIVGFEVESMIMPLLTGPHVPRFVAKGDFSRQPFVVMERIPGASLRARLDAAPLPVDEVIEIGSRVATALHDLHRQHCVHLDVKPSNVVMRPDGTAVLIDFGLAWHERMPDLLDEEFTLPMGTGPYMSPEQVQFVRHDPRSDLFALGVMLYHFTTGERPFGAPTTVTGLRRRLYADPVPPRTLRPDCPPWLQEVILRCLEVRPELRFQSGAQLALALQDPAQIALTARAERRTPAGPGQRLRRWWAAVGATPAAERPSALLERAPIVMAAVDLEGSTPELLQLVRSSVQRVLTLEPGARLACVTVRRTARIAVDEPLDEQGRSLHVKLLVGLKHWAHPVAQALRLDEGRLTFHVLEAADPASALVGFAQRTGVDHLLMGARGNSAVRRYLGSVSSRVVAEAGCSVTVLRTRSHPTMEKPPQGEPGGGVEGEGPG